MIESLFEDLQPIPTDEPGESEPTTSLSRRADSDDSLLTAMPVVQKIVRRKTIVSWHSEASDLVQEILFRLLKWRERYRQRSAEMSSADWQSFAARTAYNEINRHNSKDSWRAETPLEAESEATVRDLPLEGQSETEVRSLARLVWQETCDLSLRRRRALLLHSQKLLIYFQNSGITDEEIAESLEFSASQWNDVRLRIPLPDVQIAELTFKKGRRKSLESQANSVKKARYEARLKLRRVTDK